MAQAFASGESVSSNVKAVDAARRTKDTAIRRMEAAELAAADAELHLREQIDRVRGQWSAVARKQALEADLETGAALRALRAARERRACAAALLEWLTPERGFDRGGPARVVMGTVRGTERWSANAEPLEWGALLDQLEASLAPPAEKGPPLIPASPVLKAG
jgi:hypothetical protein